MSSIGSWLDLAGLPYSGGIGERDGVRDDKASTDRDSTLGVSAPASAQSVILLLFALVGIYQLGTGMLMGVVPVQLSLSGFPASIVGWVSTGQSIGFLVGSLLAAPVIGALGARPTLATFAILNAILAIVLWATSDAVIWTISRTIAGFSSACVLVLVEAWFAAKVTAEWRGLVFGVYMLLSRLAFMIAQIAMAVVAPILSLLFVIAALCYLLAPCVSLAIPGEAPRIGGKSIAGIWEMPLRAPAAAAAAFVHALITTSALGLFPVYAVERGIPVQQIAFLLAATQFGGLVLQLPLSFLSDRIGRRTVMTIAATMTVLFSTVLWSAEAPGVWQLATMAALWAGAPAALYSLAVAHANDIANDSERVAWSGAMLSLWGIGAAIGPLIAAVVMDRYGAASLFLFTGGLSAALVIFLVLRKLIKKRPRAPKPTAETIGPAPGTGG